MADANDNILRIDREDLDLEVELGPSEEETLGDRPRPGPATHAILQIGSAGPAFVDIFVTFDALQEAWRHCRSTTSREVAGVLLGGIWRDGGAAYVHVTRALDARFTHERMSRVTFTHQTWHDLATRMEALATDEVMVGWYHTHPGYSVFMSGYDKFIHKNFFGKYGIALVADPVAGDCGFFETRDGSVDRVPGFKLLGDPGDEPQMQALVRELRRAGRPLPMQPRPPVDVPVKDLEEDAEFRESQAAYRSFLRRFFGDLAPEPDAFSSAVAEANFTLVVRGKTLPPGGILKAIDEVIFDVTRDNGRCRSVVVRVRRGHQEGDLICTGEWYQPRRGHVADLKRQVITPRMRAIVTWHVAPDRLDVTA